MPNSEATAALLVIGDEILGGKTRDTNSAYLIARMRDLGVRLMRIVVVPDDEATIAEQVAELRGRFDTLFTSGGIGPTHDDVTIRSVARAFGRPVVRDQSLVAGLRRYYGDRVNEARLRMAEVPEGTEIVRVEGHVMPVFKVENVYVLPGVPELFESNFEAVADRFRGDPFHNAVLYTALGEGDLAEHLEQCLRDVGGVTIGSYPRLVKEGWRVKVTVESRSREAVVRALDRLIELIGREAVVGVERPEPDDHHPDDEELS